MMRHDELFFSLYYFELTASKNVARGLFLLELVFLAFCFSVLMHCIWVIIVLISTMSNQGFKQTLAKPGAALQKPPSLIHSVAQPFWKYFLAPPRTYAVSHEIDNVIMFSETLNLKGHPNCISCLWVAKILLMGGFCLLVQLHYLRVWDQWGYPVYFLNGSPFLKIYSTSVTPVQLVSIDLDNLCKSVSVCCTWHYMT